MESYHEQVSSTSSHPMDLIPESGEQERALRVNRAYFQTIMIHKKTINGTQSSPAASAADKKSGKPTLGKCTIMRCMLETAVT